MSIKKLYAPKKQYFFIVLVIGMTKKQKSSVRVDPNLPLSVILTKPAF